jgi:hypothetical protein
MKYPVHVNLPKEAQTKAENTNRAVIKIYIESNTALNRILDKLYILINTPSITSSEIILGLNILSGLNIALKNRSRAIIIYNSNGIKITIKKFS